MVRVALRRRAPTAGTSEKRMSGKFKAGATKCQTCMNHGERSTAAQAKPHVNRQHTHYR